VFYFTKEKNSNHNQHYYRITYRLKTSRSTTNKSVGVVVITVALRGSFVIKARSPKSKPPAKYFHLILDNPSDLSSLSQ